MARIKGIRANTLNPIHRILFWLVRRRFGRPVEPLRGYAVNNAVLAATTLLELAMERTHALDRRLAMLAELRVAALVGCPFCLDIGSAIATRSGIAAAQLRDLNRYATSDAFDPLAKAVLRFADEATRTPVVVDEDNFAFLRERLSERQLVELAARVAHENLRARLNHSLGYGAQGFADGTCALPDSTAASR